ncbi:MAG: segregation/condensation protein A [Pseudomonadota bacterium]
MVTDRHQNGKVPACVISIDIFEGPLDLLLYLIRKHEIDIFDIPMSFITDRYLEFLAAMQELQLDIAVEYLEVAATLAYIKSRMLLPEAPEDEETEEDEPDPREELVRRLLEYKKYKEAARTLSQRLILGKDTFTGGVESTDQQDSRIITDVSVFDLMDIAAALIEKAREKGKEGHELIADRITVAERITQIADILSVKQMVAFQSLFDEDYTVFDVVITFLAVLEMVKLHMLSVVQSDVHGEIALTRPVTYEKDEEEVVEPPAVDQEQGHEAAVESREPGTEGKIPEAGEGEGPGPSGPEADGETPPEEAEEEKTKEAVMADELSDLLGGFLKDKDDE